MSISWGGQGSRAEAQSKTGRWPGAQGVAVLKRSVVGGGPGAGRAVGVNSGVG